MEFFLSTFFVSFRLGGLFMGMPVFSGISLPNIPRVFLVLTLAACLSAFAAHVPTEALAHPWMFFGVLGRELFFGLAMGYSVRLLFLILSLALEFCGLQMGFSMASLFDPINNSQLSALAQLGVVLGILFFFAGNFHHHVFIVLARSYEFIPMGVPQFNISNEMGHLTDFVAQAFLMGLRLSMPIMLVMLLLHFVIGIFAKTAPQLNLFFNVSFIINILVGLLLVVLIMPRFYDFFVNFDQYLAKRGYGLW